MERGEGKVESYWPWDVYLPPQRLRKTAEVVSVLKLFSSASHLSLFIPHNLALRGKGCVMGAGDPRRAKAVCDEDSRNVNGLCHGYHHNYHYYQQQLQQYQQQELQHHHVRGRAKIKRDGWFLGRL